MTTAEIHDKIASILADDFEVDRARITPQATFRGDLGLDSLDIVDFIMLLQKDFNYKAPTTSYQDIQTVAMLVDFVHARIRGGS